MKYLIQLILITLTIAVSAQSKESLSGAWERLATDANQQVLVMTDGYWSFTEYNLAQKNFVGTMGGAWTVEANKLTYTYEYSTFAEVLHSQLLPAAVSQPTADQLNLGSTQWKRLDAGTPGTLKGAWLITNRDRNGTMTPMTPGPRKTMKILSGTRFQWIAYNTETRAFLGTGGGTYSTTDGRYTENIEFFSRDPERVGDSLGFDYELKDGQWHHRGKSSKGQAIYEIWSLRE